MGLDVEVHVPETVVATRVSLFLGLLHLSAEVQAAVLYGLDATQMTLMEIADVAVQFKR